MKTRPKAARRPMRRAGKETLGYNDELFDQLRDLRKRIASEQAVPPYVVFSDRALHEMARFFPSNKNEMLQINGVGETKLVRYGATFVQAIGEFLAVHPETERSASWARQPEL